MTFIDGLKDICTIKTVGITTDAYGAENEGETTVYDSIICRLGKGRSRFIRNDNAKKNQFIITYKLYVELDYNGASKGDYVYIGTEKYIIIHGQTARGGQDNHYIYELEKYE